DVLGVRLDLDERVEFAQPLCGQVRARLADAVVPHEQLTVEVVGAERAGVRQDELADSGRRQLMCDHSADAANARDEDAGVFESLLSLFAEAGHAELPRVDCPFLVAQLSAGHHAPPAIGVISVTSSPSFRLRCLPDCSSPTKTSSDARTSPSPSSSTPRRRSLACARCFTRSATEQGPARRTRSSARPAAWRSWAK